MMNIPKRISSTLLNAAAGGVTPRIGLEYMNIGRKAETTTVMTDINNITEGGSCMRFIVGRYGSGKSFMLQLIRNYAMDASLVVADTDLSADRHLTGHGGIATYRALLANLSTKARRDGGALPAILEKYLSDIYAAALGDGYEVDTPAFTAEVKKRIFTTVNSMEGMLHGFDFAKALGAYFDGYMAQDDARKGAALRWLRGEYTTKRDAKSELGVSSIVTDDNWFDYILLISAFCHAIGYGGLLVILDEAAFIFQITNTVSRNNNYEKILAMFNDTMQGRVSHLGIYVGVTPQMLEDNRRGLYSHDALATRLRDSSYAKSGHNDIGSPLIRLQTLTVDEIFALLRRMDQIHVAHYGRDALLSDAQIQAFIATHTKRLGADSLLTPRELVRDMVSLLNILNTGASFDALVTQTQTSTSTRKPDDDVVAIIDV